ncbi:MAG: TM2 domain-containing protein [Pseudomonadota bacterium]
MDDTLQQQLVYEANRKSVGATYVLWLFLGMFGAHRFYAGSAKTGAMQLLLCISIIGWLVLLPWLLADLFLIPGIVRDHNMGIIREMEYNPECEAEKRLYNPQTPEDRRRAEMLEDLRRTGFSRRNLDTSRVDR